MDLQKTFDIVDHRILLAKLSHHGIRGVSNDWFESYLSNRSQYVFINGYDWSCCYKLWCPSRISSRSPAINDLNQAIKFCKVQHFADDTNLLCLGNSIKKLNRQVNAGLKCLVNWLKANKMSLNVKKTELVIFRSKQKKVKLSEIKC